MLKFILGGRPDARNFETFSCRLFRHSKNDFRFSLQFPNCYLNTREKHMKIKLLLLIPLLASTVACSKDFEADEMLPEQDVINHDLTQASVDDSNSVEPESLLLEDKSLNSAFDSFLAQGVPKVALTRAFNFYRENRASAGGLQDTSCLIKPMSETGEIDKNSNRYDPTTLSQLKQGVRNERYIMIVDFTQPNTSKRGYMLDLQPDASGKYSVKRLTIGHGYGSQAVDGVPTVFTNSANHGTTVSGFFVTAVKTYPYSGHASSTGNYSSTGLRLYGLESTNNTAENTSKVAHGAPYVTDSKAGNSAGCAAMTIANSKEILKLMTGGILWYHHTKANNSLTYKTASCNKSSTLANN
jgi:hypothetical protein